MDDTSDPYAVLLSLAQNKKKRSEEDRDLGLRGSQESAVPERRGDPYAGSPREVKREQQHERMPDLEDPRPMGQAEGDHQRVSVSPEDAEVEQKYRGAAGPYQGPSLRGGSIWDPPRRAISPAPI